MVEKRQYLSFLSAKGSDQQFMPGLGIGSLIG